MNCHDCVELLSAFSDGELSTESTADVERHIGECAICAQVQREFLDMDAQLRLGVADARNTAARVAESVANQIPVHLEEFHSLRNRTRFAHRLRWLGSIAAAIVAGYCLGAMSQRASLTDISHHDDDIGSSAIRPFATVGVVTGPIEIALPDTLDFLACPANAKLDIGTRMRTGPNRKCELQTADGATIRLDADTEVHLPAKNEVVLQKGRVWCCDPSDDKPSPITVKSRGASIRVAYAACDVRNVDDCTEVLSLTGDVRVVGPDWQHDVPAGQKVAFAENRPAQSISIRNPVLETRWLHELLVRKNGSTEELNVRVNRLLADIGYSKMQNLLEEELRALGPRCVDPLIAFLQSEDPRHQPKRRRLFAALIVRDLAEFRSAPALVSLLSDDDAAVRHYIAEGLRRLLGRDIIATPEQWRDDTSGERSKLKAKFEIWMEEKHSWFSGDGTESASAIGN